MGEIADRMLGGEDCECCGVPLLCDACAGLGFPAYCSTECADDRGATPEQVCRHTPDEKGECYKLIMSEQSE